MVIKEVFLLFSFAGGACIRMQFSLCFSLVSVLAHKDFPMALFGRGSLIKEFIFPKNGKLYCILDFNFRNWLTARR